MLFGDAKSMFKACAARSIGAMLLASWIVPGTAAAQELVPRAYWPAPQGTNILSLAYQYSFGDIVTDPSLPVVGVDSKIHVGVLGYQHTFSMLGRTANAQLSLPFSSGETTGTYLGLPAERDVSGLSDARLRVSVNLRGAPAMTQEQFRALAQDPTTLVGISLLVQAPTGQYDPDRLINIGTNRWSLKPALGVIYPFSRGWMLEFEVGGWFFGDNDEFIGQTRKQDPVLSTEAHLVRQFDSGLWAALDVNFYTGGRTTVGSDRKADLQRNARVGATVLWPFRRGHALRGSYSTGVVTESGGDYQIVSISYLYAW